VTEHDHWPAGKPLVVSRHQRTPERCLDPQHLKEVPGDEGGSRETALDARPDGAQQGEGIREDAGLSAHRVVFRPGERQRRIRAGACPPLHGKQLAGAPHRIGTKKNGVVNREHHADQPEAKTDRRDDGDGGEGRAAERAEGVEYVARQIIDEGGAAGIATLVGGKGY
jgi:hypothetical protein